VGAGGKVLLASGLHFQQKFIWISASDHLNARACVWGNPRLCIKLLMQAPNSRTSASHTIVEVIYAPL
jgi:hypothetical protein